MHSQIVNDSSYVKSSPRSQQGRRLPPYKGFAVGGQEIVPSGSLTTNPNQRQQPRTTVRSPFNLNARKDQHVLMEGIVASSHATNHSQNLAATIEQDAHREHPISVNELLKIDMTLVLQDLETGSLNQIDKHISSFIIIEGQKYKKKRFYSSKELLAHLAEALQARGQRFKLVNSSNTRKYGDSDKQIQTLISGLNQRNYKLLETIIHYQQNESQNIEYAKHGQGNAQANNKHSSAALSLDHSIEIIPFSHSGSNTQTPLRKDNSLPHGLQLKQTEQRLVPGPNNKESLLVEHGNSKQKIVSRQAVLGTGNNSINNSLIKNARGSPVAGTGPRLTSSQQYLSQMNTINTKLISAEHQGNKNKNANGEHPLLGKPNTGSCSALGVQGADRGLALGVHGKTLKTVRVKEQALGQPQQRFRSLQQAAPKRDAQQMHSKNRDSSKGSQKSKYQRSMYAVNQAYEYEVMVNRPIAQARKMLGAFEQGESNGTAKRTNQTPPKGNVKLKDFQEDGKLPVRDGMVPCLPQNTVNNISLLKSHDRKMAQQNTTQMQSKTRPQTALSKSNNQLASDFFMTRTESNRKNLQAPSPQPDAYYGDYDRKEAAANSAEEGEQTEAHMLTYSQQKRSAKHERGNASKDNVFRQKKKSATTDKKPLINITHNTAKTNSQSRQGNARQQVVKSNFIRKGGAAVQKPLLAGQRQQRIVGNTKATTTGVRKSQLRSQEPRSHTAQPDVARQPATESRAEKSKLLHTVDGLGQAPLAQLDDDTQDSKKRLRAEKQKMRTIQTVQVDFDADMPVEGRNGEDDANNTPQSMHFENKEVREDSGARQDRDRYADYLNDGCNLGQEGQKPVVGLQNVEEIESTSQQNEQVMEQSMQKPVQSIQSLENLVKLRQRLDKDLSSQRHAGSQSILKNEQKNANKALEVIQQNMLRDTATYNILALEGQSSNTVSRPPLTLKEQFERDYQYPPSADQNRPIDLPDRVLLTLVQYLGMRNLVKFQKLSRHWYCKIQQVFNNMSQPMESRFRAMYNDYFNFIKAKIVIGPTEFGHLRGIRIDRIMEIQLKEDSPDVLRNAGKTFKIENEYRYQDTDRNGNPSTSKFFTIDKEQSRNGPRQSQKSVVFRPQGRQVNYQKNKSIVYHNVYRFDIVKSRSRPRNSWIHLSDRMPGYSQNEIQVAPGDRIIIGFCIYNLNGFVDISTLQWAIPSFAKIHESMVNFLSYNREEQIQRFADRKQARGLKILCDIDRICDVEDSVYDWYKYDVSGHRKPQTPIQMPIVIPQNLFEYFEVLDVWYNESDQHYNKKLLKAVKPSFDKRPGSTTNFNLILQFDERRRFSLSILPRESPIINEIRRRGVVTDRDKTEEEVQIRVGDLIMLYETKHIPQELQMITNLGD